jgi:single-stranded-DNA-specific exonuclease
MLEPFGVGNPKPLFAQKNLIFLSAVRIGANKNFARFRIRTPDGNFKQLVYFGNSEAFDNFVAGKYGAQKLTELYAGNAELPISVVYQLGSNTYRGKTEVQYIMQYYC